MRRALAWAITMMLIGTAVPAQAGPRALPFDAVRASLSAQPSVTVVPVAGGATLQTGVGAAVAEFGTIAGGRSLAAGVTVVRRPASYAVISAIGLRIQAPVGNAFALQAFLDGAIPGVQVRLDGITLTGIPQTFALHVLPGVVTRHRIELIVNDGATTAQIPSAIPLELGAVPE